MDTFEFFLDMFSVCRKELFDMQSREKPKWSMQKNIIQLGCSR